jgi:hypothetical protein
MMVKHINTLAFGIIAGIIVPGIFYFIFFYSKLHNFSLEYFQREIYLGKLLPLIISRCILPNLVLFFIFNWLNWHKATKGVFISTLALTVILFALKIIFF